MLILYASQTGTAQEYAERFAGEAFRRNIPYRIMSVHEYSSEELPTEPIVLFFISTTGDGEAPTTMQMFWRALLRKDYPLLAGKKYAVFGLGDSSYEKFNYAGKRLYRRLEQLDAQFITNRIDADEQHPLGLDGAYGPWSEDLWTFFNANFSWPLEPLKELSPKVYLEEVGLDHQKKDSAFRTPVESLNNNFSDLYLERTLDHRKEGSQSLFEATVTENRRITSPTHFQDVRHVVFKSTQFPKYDPGDVVILKSANPDDTVDEQLRILGWQDDGKLYKITAQRPEAKVPSYPVTIRSLLKFHLDITAPPKRVFFQIIANFVDESHPNAALYREKLTELASPEGIDLYLDYVYRPKRTPAEALADFSVNVPIDFVFDLFPALRPREYSIASASCKYPNEIHIAAAMVEYRTSLMTSRWGVCSKWLSLFPTGNQVSIGIRKGNWILPPNGTPIILIAAGTGIAPMRAIIQHFLPLSSASPSLPPASLSSASIASTILLFFGCRYHDRDYHYHEEWAKYPGLKVFVLGSRDVPGKTEHIDVLLKRNSDTLQEALKLGAYIYVAGNSKLPALVKKTLIEITGDVNLPARLSNLKRLQIEAWS